MNSYLFAAILTVYSVQSFAQTEPKEDVVKVEFVIPVDHSKEWKDALEEQKNNSLGFGGGVVFKPFTQMKGESALVRALKKTGFRISGEGHLNNNFPDFRYFQETYVSDSEFNSYCVATDISGQRYYTNTCYSCSYDYYSTCRDESVYGRESYIKYVSGSIYLGTELPVVTIKRLKLNARTGLRLDFVREGRQTDALKGSTEASLEVGAGASYNVGYLTDVIGEFDWTVTGRNRGGFRGAAGVSFDLSGLFNPK